MEPIASITGIALSLGVIAEVGALALFPRLEERFSLRILLATAFALTSLRWFLLGRAESAAALVLLQLLHGAMRAASAAS